MNTPIGSLDPAHRDVHIWGGGVAGLLMAHFLARQGFRIHLYEKSERLGGKLQSFLLPQGVMETAANAIYATPEIEAWLKELGLKVIPATQGLKRRLWDGRARRPLSLALLLRAFLLCKRPPALTTELSVAAYFRPLLGPWVERLLTPALSGVYAASADELSVHGVWPKLKGKTYWQALRSLKGARARSVSFPGGMQDFIDALAKSFAGEVHLNHAAPFIPRPNTIVCTDAHTAAELLGQPALGQVGYLPVSSATAILQTPPEARATFGFLFPRHAGVHALGVLFNQEIFPGRAGVTFIHRGDEDVAALVAHDLRRLGWSASELKIHSWKRALPLYDGARTRALASLTLPRHTVLFGNYVAGISLRDMITAARDFARRY